MMSWNPTRQRQPTTAPIIRLPSPDVTTPTNAGCDDQYTRVITYIATDECGNVSDPYTVTITVNDNVAPTWNQAPGALDVTEVCADDVVEPNPPTATDNCPNNTATVSVQSQRLPMPMTSTPASSPNRYRRVLPSPYTQSDVTTAYQCRL
ncbi:MAG: hypothetical protein H6556_21145 [Lewinellaceae bacterium]|nr:hypothetical protein [Lewinellaceae bacterium]